MLQAHLSDEASGNFGAINGADIKAAVESTVVVRMKVG